MAGAFPDAMSLWGRQHRELCKFNLLGGLAATGATVVVISGGLLTRYAGLAHRATGEKARRQAAQRRLAADQLGCGARGVQADPVRQPRSPLGGARRARIPRRHSEPGGASVPAAARSVVIMQQIGGDVAVEYDRDPLAQPAEREDDHAGARCSSRHRSGSGAACHRLSRFLKRDS